MPEPGAGVIVERHANGVATLTMTDPAHRNALGPEMAQALSDAVVRVREDPGLRCVVLTGHPPGFCAGGNFDMLAHLRTRAQAADGGVEASLHAFYERCLAFRSLPVPVLAAINGDAVGAGLCLALACDIRVVAQQARVGLNFSRLGVHPGMGGSWLLPRVVSAQVAARMLYTGSLVTGEQAARDGLALTAVPVGEVLERTLDLADDIATSSPRVVGALVTHLRDDRLESLPGALRREARRQAEDFAAPDVGEGLTALRERRRPDFGSVSVPVGGSV